MNFWKLFSFFNLFLTTLEMPRKVSSGVKQEKQNPWSSYKPGLACIGAGESKPLSSLIPLSPGIIIQILLTGLHTFH